MSLLRDIKNDSNWNIGFCEMTPEELVKSRKLYKIQWMKHRYKDRFFADPFILDVTDNEIVMFSEEFVFAAPPGLLVELILDKKTKVLKQRYELLKLSTHLSYPAIIRDGETIYVYPENGASGQLNIYKYDAKKHSLVEPHCILDLAVADSTIYKCDDNTYLLTATKFPNNQEGVFAFKSNSITGPFEQVGTVPFNYLRSCSRPAGNFFKTNNILFRPAQDCVIRYGAATTIMSFNPESLEEEEAFVLKPSNYAFNLGLHTINFHKDLCVIDGCGFLYPTTGRIYASPLIERLRTIAKSILHKK